ncbi:MAG: GDYXXLXY domain-containing protein [Chitinophagales bacterium]
MKINKFIVIGIVLFQLLIIAGMFAKSMYPLVSGQEVQFKVRPVDPRDIFRGQYVRLGYDFNRINLKAIKNDLDTTLVLHFGDVLHLEVAPDEEVPYYKTVGLWQNAPATLADKHLLLKAYCNENYGWEVHDSYFLRLKCGIESYYTDPKTALELENAMRQNNQDSIDVAVKVMVADNGQSRIKAVVYQ